MSKKLIKPRIIELKPVENLMTVPNRDNDIENEPKSKEDSKSDENSESDSPQKPIPFKLPPDV